MRTVGKIETTVGPDAQEVEIAYRFSNPSGPGIPLVYVHGWGCSQKDFEGAVDEPKLADRPLLSFDFPGHGESSSFAGDLSITDVVGVMRDVLGTNRVSYFAVAGHSVGGLVAVKYATKYPCEIGGIVSVVGNMEARDCFLTGEVADGRQTRGSLAARFQTSNNPGFRRYAEGLSHVDEKTYVALAASAVQACVDGSVFADFCGLQVPKLFVYGAEAIGSLPYLDTLQETPDMTVHEVPDADHFPAVDNPTDFYGAIGAFMKEIDEALLRPQHVWPGASSSLDDPMER